ncbi:MAG: nucleoside monophosphate kinase [Verrucomicrobia bacterium]|nr:nucleoside monophosphate kinase [Verrucomicrobiota bacterium]MCG2678995.1 nucleoside monophosphate kinase [Kiritimatiellia bacterium]MBU4248347.1 nucleoside monophosphate kinase [Verrucomicrobiota bacterium]MBU4289732.1 nucleoside monophosphate kinase [Verrucomicrobiota bacterium]MBU4428554.1 nucleoside monophosphate kinase [Verrucomicrobiota bacterium]
MSIEAIILLGAPGAGKGTIAEALAAATDYVHISTGDMLRAAVKQGTELGRAADACMQKGNLVSDDLIVKMVVDHLSRGPADRRYMFDGFPRTLAQAELLAGHFNKIRACLPLVFLLEVSREVVLDRLTGRRVCRNCGAIFHIRNIPPKQAGRCDACGGELIQRPDDMRATIENRLDVFHRQTGDLIAYYDRQHLLVRVDSSRRKDQTVADMLEIMRKTVSDESFCAARES